LGTFFEGVSGVQFFRVVRLDCFLDGLYFLDFLRGLRGFMYIRYPPPARPLALRLGAVSTTTGFVTPLRVRKTALSANFVTDGNASATGFIRDLLGAGPRLGIEAGAAAAAAAAGAGDVPLLPRAEAGAAEAAEAEAAEAAAGAGEGPLLPRAEGGAEAAAAAAEAPISSGAAPADSSSSLFAAAGAAAETLPGGAE